VPTLAGVNDASPHARTLARNGAVLMLLALLTGIPLAAAMTGKLPADVHAMVAAHIGAILGALWMVAVAVTLPMLRYGPAGQARLALGVTVPCFANWFVTFVKGFLKVSGVDFTGNATNDAVFVVLNLLVVFPALATAVAWIYGFGGAPPTQRPN